MRLTRTKSPACRNLIAHRVGSYTHLVKDELARPPAIGKDTFTLGTAYPQAFLAQEKCAVFLSRAGKILATENFSMKRQPPSHCTC
jgi:hypothetical protein